MLGDSILPNHVNTILPKRHDVEQVWFFTYKHILNLGNERKKRAPSLKTGNP
jgi:hypothetical protein